MSSAAYKKGQRDAAKGKTLAYGTDYYKEEPLALKEWVLGWQSEQRKP